MRDDINDIVGDCCTDLKFAYNRFASFYRRLSVNVFLIFENIFHKELDYHNAHHQPENFTCHCSSRFVNNAGANVSTRSGT